MKVKQSYEEKLAKCQETERILKKKIETEKKKIILDTFKGLLEVPEFAMYLKNKEKQVLIFEKTKEIILKEIEIG